MGLGRDLVAICVEDDTKDVRIWLCERIQVGPEQGHIVTTELPDPVRRRFDADGHVHYVVDLHLGEARGHEDCLGHLAERFDEVRWDLQLKERHTIRSEGALAQHYAGILTRSERARESENFGSPVVVDGLHFYSSEHDPNLHWGYGGEVGPSQWGLLEAADEACFVDRPEQRQSPIFIDPARTTECGTSGGVAQIHYRRSRISQVNNGHTVMASLLAPGEVLEPERGSYIEADSKRFWLLQFHMHTPSEHMLATREAGDDREFPLELHFVHRSWDGQYAVLAVLADVGNEGDSVNVLQELIGQFPDELNVPKEFDGTIDPSRLLPGGGKASDVFAYEGSLTTPPCTEGIRWYVMKQPVQVTADELARIREIVGAPNARREPELDPPVPPVGDRVVRHCG